MTTLQALLAFVAAASLLTVTPGVDTAMVLRAASAAGPRPAAFAAFGIGLGCLVWGAVVSVGLGALLATSKMAFTAVKWVGAVYLFYLGARLVLHPRSTFDAVLPSSTVKNESARLLRQGLLTNLMNHKVGVFYVTFLPQFIPPGASVAAFSFLLAMIHVLLGAIWFAILIAATMPAGRLLRRPTVIRALDRVTGGVFIAFGVRLALAK